MKKTISILLVLVMALSLCACGAENKYAGTYICKSGGNETKMTLSANGTGTIVKEVKSASAEDILQYGYVAGYVLEEYDLTWEVSDGYLFIDASGTTYYYNVFSNSSDGKSDSFTESYELKGKELFTLEGDSSGYIKEQ